DERQLPEFSRKNDPEYFQVWLGDSSQTIRSATLKDASLPHPETGDRQITKLELPDRRVGRALSMVFPLRSEDEEPKGAAAPTAMITVAADIDEVQQRMSRLALLLLGVCGVATGVSLAAVRLIVDRSLTPASEIAEKISRVGLADLKERIAVESSPRELVPIVERLNEMLGRLDAAFAREKAFTGNVAHELRTPLAGVKAALEVCANQPREPTEYRRVLGECLSAVDLMHQMVDSLLSITRLGAGQITLRPESIALAPMLRECWDQIAPNGKTMDVQWQTPGDIEVEADRHLLRSVVINLLDNAASYVDDNGTIRIATRAQGDRVELAISNTGNTISPEDIAKVFEPFWRGDVSRTATGRHCGLGLTLTRGYVELMGGTISASSESNGVFVARVSLPAARITTAATLPQDAGQRAGTLRPKPSRVPETRRI
ncbi:MAG TPA: ATP-binding protein, partial [Tepidisphaeraceae bacterium]|nr:ATP-binding protein [Tepidisphaeraceae bacterium]